MIMDEFHYYGDRDRGWAWQIPLLELAEAQFLLMSATLGDTVALRNDLSARTGRATQLVATAKRPVPLDFEYRDTSLLMSVEQLLKDKKSPIYIVYFTQKQATAQAQSFTSLSVLNSAEKAEVKARISGFRFDTPIGKDLKRFVLAGVGVHHAGLLPKYRLLMEKLAKQGLLPLICGTDTLGVGVNVPIRTVLLTQLYKYDGRRHRVLTVREFQQIAGRAGRKGFDDAGSVCVQAPEHVVENKQAEAKALNNPKKLKKLVKKQPPSTSYAHYDERTMRRLCEGQPETLRSSFLVTHAIMLNVLSRYGSGIGVVGDEYTEVVTAGDGCADMRRLLVDNHEPRARQRQHIRRAIGVFRSLVAADVLEIVPVPVSTPVSTASSPEQRNMVRVNMDLQDEFSLNQPLAIFILEAVAVLDANAPDYHLQVLSVVESVLDDPMQVLLAQRDKARDELMNRMKAEGVEYSERMERLAEVSWPRPEVEFIEPAFKIFAASHPWVGGLRPSAKSVAREMFEMSDTFNQYVSRYGLKRSEGLLLRYLSECYKTLSRTVIADAINERLRDVIEWLSVIVRQVDSSLINEWERLSLDLASAGSTVDLTAGAAADSISGSVVGSTVDSNKAPDITDNRRAFNVMIRNEMFLWVQLLAKKDHAVLVNRIAAASGMHQFHGGTSQFHGKWSVSKLDDAMSSYWAEHDWIGVDAEARSVKWVELAECTNLDKSGKSGNSTVDSTTVDSTVITVRQTLSDPSQYQEWVVDADVDIAASQMAGRVVMRLLNISRR